MMSPEEIADAIPYLSKYQFGLAIAFPYEEINDAYEKLLLKLHAEGILTYLWVLMPDDLGYWIHEGNANQFAEKVQRIQRWFSERNLPFNLAVDMEMPLDQMKVFESGSLLKLLPMMRKNINKKRFESARRVFDQIAETIREQGGKSVAPIAFNLVNEIMNGKKFIQDLFQTPIANWDRISPMFYTSLFEQMTKGLFKKKDARFYMYRTLLKLTKKEGKRASVSLGTIGPGKLGTEEGTGYNDPADFSADVQAALAAEIDDIFVFNLAGIMRSKDPESWFLAITEAEPKIPQKTGKGNLLYRIGNLLGRI